MGTWGGQGRLAQFQFLLYGWIELLCFIYVFYGFTIILDFDDRDDVLLFCFVRTTLGRIDIIDSDACGYRRMIDMDIQVLRYERDEFDFIMVFDRSLDRDD